MFNNFVLVAYWQRWRTSSQGTRDKITPPSPMVEASLRGTSCLPLIKFSDLAQAGADRKCKSLVFSTGGDVEFVYVAPNVGDPPDRVVVSSLFPCGAISARLTCFPGTDVKLLNEWRVIVSNNVASSPFNKAVMKYCGREWTGNIALIKYSRSNRQKLNNVPCTEFEFAHLLLSA